MYGTTPAITIGSLRFSATLATRQQVPDPAGTGVLELFANRTKVWASVTPIGLATYIAGEQIDNGPTHMITFRYMPNLDYFDVVLVETHRPDGTTQQALYRVFRIAEIEGRQRFTRVDAILEQRAG